MNRPGSGPQPVRGLPLYTQQSSGPQRNTPLSASRLTNGNGSGWPFGMPASGGGLPRPSGGMTTFAQTIGGGQSGASLDPSEFPSLSSTQSQLPTSSQTWAHSIQRNAISPLSSGQRSGQQGSAILSDDLGGHFGFGQSNQPRATAVDDFPPLGASSNGGDIGAALNGSLLGQGHIGAPRKLGPYAGISKPVADAAEVKSNGTRAVGGPVRQTRSPSSPQQHLRPTSFEDENIGGVHQGLEEIEQFGLSGLLKTVRADNSDQALLAVGQDLTQLGLDLNQPEVSLYPSFGTPWAVQATKPMEPDFTLPACYTVTNTRPIDQKLESFAEETLFYIFYTMPRDIMQEHVANELSRRGWRYHKIHKFWLSKDAQSQPRAVSEHSEQGSYVIFDPQEWAKRRETFLLEYALLERRVHPSLLAQEQQGS